jgi:hypothetical protein
MRSLLQGCLLRWQGPGAIIPGVAWIGDRGLHWVPGGRLWGGRAFELHGKDIERIQVSSLGVRSTGLVVTTSEHDEAWLLLHGSDVARLLVRLRGPASGPLYGHKADAEVARASVAFVRSLPSPMFGVSSGS